LGLEELSYEAKTYKDTVKLILYSTLLVLISLFVPLISIFTTLFWFVPLVILAVTNNFKDSLVGCIIIFFIISLISFSQNTFLFFVQYAPVALTYCYLFEKRAKFKTVITSGLIVSVFSTIIRILYIVFVLGINYSEWLSRMTKMADETIAFYKSSGLWEQITKGPINPDDFQEMIYTFSEFMANITPAVLITFGLFFSLISLLVTIRVLKKKNLPVPEITEFMHWKLPWQMVWPAIIALSVLLFSDYYDNKLILILSQNILYILVPFFLLNGFSSALYFVKKMNLSLLFKIILLAVIIFNFPLFLILILLLGLFDPLINLRKKNV
jgi:uncharacterized protein YybS (DUF2232 family)